jgi:hypothetical protein
VIALAGSSGVADVVTETLAEVYGVPLVEVAELAC